MFIQVGALTVQFENDCLCIEMGQSCFQTKTAGQIEMKNGEIYALKDFANQTVKSYSSGTYEGFYVEYRDHPKTKLALRTFYLINTTTYALKLSLLALEEDEDIKEIRWPSSFEVESGYHVLPLRQGLLYPIGKNVALDIPFNGQFCSAAAYLAMLGTICQNGSGVLMISETPWDMRYYLENDALGFAHLPSLGKMRYRRDLVYQFFQQADYNTLAKAYRHVLKERGMLRTLQEKSIALPAISELIKSSFVHMGICTYVQPDSRFFDPDDPTKNNSLTTFAKRKEEMKSYYQMGMKHLYLHLDGWGIAYDNGHPDVMPINEKAGGPEGMAALADQLHELGYLFGIHDQYRDYYHRAKSYDLEYSVQDVDGNHYEHCFWAGGAQNYLCASLAKDYVKRNFNHLFEQGIHLDGAYLDVFTCNDLDECANVNHQMTRRDCAEAREACFWYLVSQNILPSSEEVNEWAMRSLVFCHYAPYEFQMHESFPEQLIGIPLFNLVFHDCLVIPWMMDRPQDDYMLYALLNGGAPYFRRDGAYPNIDGSFENGVLSPEEQVERCQMVSAFHEKVAGVEMVSHRLLDEKGRRQESCFANGWCVTIDLDQGAYHIELKKGNKHES